MTQTDPSDQMAPFAALIGDWSTETAHVALPGVVIPGRARFEWLPGNRFLVWRAETEHPAFPTSTSIIGIMEGDQLPSMQYFDSRGVHRRYGIAFDGSELKVWRDEPAFAQRFSAALSADGSTLKGVGQLNKDNQGFRDDLTITSRRLPRDEVLPKMNTPDPSP